MGIYSTFFLASPADLPKALPGWKLPLALPVRRQRINPFTGASTWLESCEPDWPEDHEDLGEVGCTTGLTGFANWSVEELQSIYLRPLCKALDLPATFEHAMYCPPSLAATLEVMPDRFLLKLRTMDVHAIAAHWAAALSADEYTHSISGERVWSGYSTAETEEILRSLVMLAQKATSRQSLYLLLEA
ncbi:MAG: hypothetical protein K2X32_09810 [Phycisphaerales bacterium]|nr:hypothetical protein [Phycisphaerales bacterium]